MNPRRKISSAAYSIANVGANPWMRDNLELAKTRKRDKASAHLAKAAFCLTGDALTNLCTQLVTRSYRQKGHEILGIGYHSVVVQDGDDNVKKLHHRTLRFSDKEKETYIAQLSERQDLLVDAFPDITVPQRFGVEAFSPNPALECVVSHQAYIKDGEMVDMRYPSENILSFLHAAQDLYQRTGTMPDIVGYGNIMENNNKISIVDTIPFLQNDPTNHAALHHALTILALHSSALQDLQLQTSNT